MTLDQLRRELQKGNLQRLYAIVGDNMPARRQTLSILQEHVCPGDMATWGVQEVDGQQMAASAIVAMANTPPFIGEQRLIVVYAFEGMPLAEQEGLLAGMPASASVVVLICSSIDKRTKAGQALVAKSVLVEVAEPKPDGLVPWLINMARAAELEMNVASAQALVDIAGSDTGFLAQEVEKLAVYLGGRGAITPQLVNLLAARGEAEAEQFGVFRLTEAIVEGKTTQALQLLDELLNAGEPALRVLAMVARQYRQLLAAKAWYNDGVAAAAKALNMKTYPVEKLFAQVRRFSAQDIEKSIGLILNADMALKTGSDPAGTLRMLTINLCTKRM